MYHSLLLTLVKKFLVHFKTLVNQHIKNKNLKQIKSCFGCVPQSKAFIIKLTYVTNFYLFYLFCFFAYVCMCVYTMHFVVCFILLIYFI